MRYQYKARTKEGKLQKGTIETSSQKAALYLLEKYGLYPTSLKEVKKEKFFQKRISFWRTPKKDIISFTRQLAIMLNSGVSPIEVLKSQITQTENPDFREKILKIAEIVEGGGSLSQAFSLFPKIFDKFYVSVVKSGEATGKVTNSLAYLASHLEREYNLKQKIKSAMIYPAFVITVFVAVCFLATFFIIPRLSEILKTFGGKLPLMTKVVISFSNFVKEGGWILILIILGVLFFLPFFIKRFPKTRELWDRLLLKIPIVGSFSKKVNLTCFAENLSVLLKAGLPITQALKITGQITGNSLYQKIIFQAKEEVGRGEKISSVFSLYPREVPPFVLQMILTGEETGKLDETLMEIVSFYQQEIDRFIGRLPHIIEPLLILFLGIGVAILAISVFIPLFKIGLGGFGM